MKSRITLSSAVLLSLLLYEGALVFAQKPELVVQTGHSGTITTVAFSGNGKIVATGASDNTIRIWDAGTGRQVRTLTGHAETVNSISFSADGRTLASAGGDKTVRLWDVATGRTLSVLNTAIPASSIAFGSDGTLACSSYSEIDLWDSRTSTKLRTLPGHTVAVTSLAVTKDGKTLATGSEDNTIKLWDVTSGSELRTFVGHTDFVKSVAFSPDGRTLASGSADKTIRLWDVTAGQVRVLTGHTDAVVAISIGGNGQSLASVSRDGTLRIWDVASGRELHNLTDSPTFLGAVAFSPDGKTVAATSLVDGIKLWDAVSGKHLRSLVGHTDFAASVACSPDQKIFASSSGKTITLWDMSTGFPLKTLSDHPSHINSLAFSPDGKTLASGSADKTVRLWNVGTGTSRTLTGHSDWVSSVAFSPDGKMLASGSNDRTVMLWDVDSGRPIRTLPAHSDQVNAVTFHPNGKTLASGSGFISGDDNSIKLWDVASGSLIQTWTKQQPVFCLAFNATGATLASGGHYIEVWDMAASRILWTTPSNPETILSLAFTANSQTLASGGYDGTVRLWDLETGRETRKFVGHSNSVKSIAFLRNDAFLISGSYDATVGLWQVARAEMLASLLVLDQKDWAVIAPDGRFDASSNGQKLMHWMVGSQPVDLEQLKVRYYEPKLLAKIIAGLPLSDVSKFEDPKLCPDVQYELAGSASLSVTLSNRGGGIGRVQIFVNDKEFIADARDDRLKVNPNISQASLTVDLSKAFTAKAGEENKIRVVAWNLENYISSRGDEVAWIASGSKASATPEVYAIVAGVSRYASPVINLSFAAKDAVDMANAIELGAKRLFGADKVHVSLLTTANDPRAIAPTKENFAKAFAAARNAKPTDILFVYLAGHGITLANGTDTYCYLTQDARSTNPTALSDPGVRRQAAVTSDDLVEWIKQIPANKQAIILDTCAAGAAQGQLTLAAMRNASGDAIRAIDRAKDRTGSYILMGSAADAVSYETSQFGQGILTYSLLKGMKGPALRDDTLVDISRLFRFAREEVEQLARNVEKIQRPIIFAPKDDTFDVGQLNLEDRQRISLRAPKPIILRPLFFDAQADDDTLGVMRSLRELLRDETLGTGGAITDAVLVFVDVEDFSGGIRPTGKYSVNGDNVSLLLRLKRDGSDIATVPVNARKPDLAAKVLEEIKTVIARF